MTTPSNDQDPAKHEASKPNNLFQPTNLFKAQKNPFFATKIEASSGGLLNSAASNISQPDGKTGIFGANTSNLFNQGGAQPTTGGLFTARPQPQKEGSKQEDKTSATGVSGSTTNWSSLTKTQGESTKQESISTSGGISGFNKPSEKQETKTPGPTGALFGASVLSKTEDKPEKQETKTDAPGMFGKTQEGDAEKQSSGGLFGLTKPEKEAMPPGGLFGGSILSKNEDKTEKQETKIITPSTTGLFAGGGLFGGAQVKTEAPKQETKPAMFGGQTGNLTLGATTGTTQSSSTMFQAREAPTKKRKDETSTLSPEKKTTGLNISGLPTTGVQSSLLNQPSKTTNLFGQSTKEQPKVDDSKLDAVLKSAIAKEEKITQKIKDITSKMNNAQVVDQFLKEQSQAIDEFYAEFTQNLVKRVTEIANQQKQALKKKLSEEVQEFKKTTEELTGHFNKLLAENSLAQIKDQLLSAAKNKKDAEQAVRAVLATSFELENGFSPLVKKYKAIKYTIPSLNLLSKPIDRQPATKQILLQKAEVVLPELEKVIEDINIALIDAIGSLSHPLKAYLPKISKCIELENSLLAADFPFELPGVSSEENTIPRDSKIREVVYKLHKNEAEKLRGLNILSKDGEEELVLRVKPVSVRYDIVPGDLMLVNQAPCEIKSKNSPQGTNDIEFELENVLTGIPQSEKLHSKWDQVHELVLTESLVLVKPNNSQKGYYTLMNLKDPKSTRGLVKAIKTDRTLNEKLQKELESILAEEKRALVQVLRIKDEDIIVSCKKLRR